MEIDWISYFAIKGSEWLNPLLHAVGLVICCRAYWRCRKLGYLMIGIYYVLALGGRLLGPTINEVLENRFDSEPALSPSAQEQFEQEYMALHRKYFPAGQPVTRNINFPVGPLVLVLGVWLVARREPRHAIKGGSV